MKLKFDEGKTITGAGGVFSKFGIQYIIIAPDMDSLSNITYFINECIIDKKKCINVEVKSIEGKPIQPKRNE